jgi:hypothetical protein
MTTDPNQRKGFAGLEDMTSEVDVPEPVYRAPKPTPSVSTPPSPASNTTRHQPFEVDESRLAPPKSKGMSSQMKWMIGIGVFIGLAVIGSLNDKTSSSNYSAPAVYEEMPTPGSGQVLADNQIRYCLSQDIRLTGWGAAVDHYSQTAIDSFNAAVSDYNARCSNYKYRRGALERVRSEVEARRGALDADGRLKASINR